MEKYTGTDNLEILKTAKNYNSFLVHRVSSQWNGNGIALDFGAGIGSFALPLRSQGKKIFCIETDVELNRRLKEDGFVTGTTLDDFQNSPFDYIYTLNVLEHIEDDKEILRKMMVSLKPGGMLYIYVPAFNLIFSSMDRKVGHFRRYRRSQLASVLRGLGYDVVRARYVDSIGFFVTLLYKAIGSKKGDLNPRAVFIFDRLIFPLSRFFDLVLGFFFGKNLEVVAQKPLVSEESKWSGV